LSVQYKLIVQNNAPNPLPVQIYFTTNETSWNGNGITANKYAASFNGTVQQPNYRLRYSAV
jgi:hypothetical protein